MTDAEIAGYMDWRGPGAYTERQLVRIRRIVEEVRRRETEACAVIAETPVSGEQDDITMQAKDRAAAAIRARGQK